MVDLDCDLLFGVGLAGGGVTTRLTTFPMALLALVKPSPTGSVEFCATQLARVRMVTEASEVTVVVMIFFIGG